MTKSQQKYQVLILINMCSDYGKPKALHTGCYPHLGIFALRSFIREKINDHKLYNINIIALDGEILEYDEIKTEINKIIGKYDKVIFGFSVAINNYKNTCDVSKYIKSISKDITIIYGGAFVSGMIKSILYTNPYVNYLVYGDGETPLYNLLVKNDNLDNIPGLYSLTNIAKNKNYFEKNKEDIQNLPDPFLPEDNFAPYFNNYHEIFPDRNQYRLTNIYTKKNGCSLQCSFCATNGGRKNQKKMQNIWEEIYSLNNTHKINMFFDATENTGYDWLNDLNEFKRKYYKELDVYFSFYASGNEIIKKGFIKNFRAVGGNKLFVGFESGDEEILRRNCSLKNTVEINNTSFDVITKNNLALDASFILGLPGENKRSLHNTLTFAGKVADYDNLDLLAMSIIMPLPGTSLWNKYIMKNSYLRNNYYRNDTNGKFIPPVWDEKQLQKDFIQHTECISLQYDELIEVQDKFINSFNNTKQW